MKILLIKFSVVLIIIFPASLSVDAQEGFIKTNGDSRLHYRIFGVGADTLVVPDGAWQYPYYEKYGKGMVYIIYDCRNRGYSDTNPAIGIGNDVEGLEAVRKFFGINKMNVLGWSYLGGMVALYASKYPQHTKSVIQVGPIPLNKGEHFDAYLKSTTERRSKALDSELANLIADGVDKISVVYCRKFYEASLYSILSISSKANEFAANVPCTCLNEQPEKVGALLQHVFGDLKSWDWSDQLKNVKANTLIIHGIDDNIPLESSKLWAAKINKSRLLTFSSSGHMPFAEESTLYFQSIRDFLSHEKIK